MKITGNRINADVILWVHTVSSGGAPVCAPVALLQLVVIAGYYVSLRLATGTQPGTSPRLQLRILGLKCKNGVTADRWSLL